MFAMFIRAKSFRQDLRSWNAGNGPAPNSQYKFHQAATPTPAPTTRAPTPTTVSTTATTSQAPKAKEKKEEEDKKATTAAASLINCGNDNPTLDCDCVRISTLHGPEYCNGKSSWQIQYLPECVKYFT